MQKTLIDLKYSFYLSVHPLKGFWELKHENQTGTFSAAIIVALVALFTAITKKWTAYLFNPVDPVSVSVVRETFIILLLYFSFCVTNWCLTTLFDGEGRFKDICISTAYALTPFLLSMIAIIPISYILSLREASIYTFISGLGIAWSALLIFTGTLVTHQYTFAKTIVMLISIAIGLFVLAYVYLLFFSLIQQVGGFIIVVYRELTLRFYS